MNFSTLAILAALCAASATAAPVRQRTNQQYKSVVKSDENYDPYMGIQEDRKLEEHDHSMSMSMPKPATIEEVTDDGYEAYPITAGPDPIEEPDESR